MIFPILAWYFFEFPPWSLILNLVVIPLFSVLLVSGLVGSLLLWASIPLGELLLGVCKGIFWLYEGCCRIAALLPGARVITGQPEVWQMVFYYLCLAGSLSCCGTGKGNALMIDSVPVPGTGTGLFPGSDLPFSL